MLRKAIIDFLVLWGFNNKCVAGVEVSEDGSPNQILVEVFIECSWEANGFIFEVFEG